MKPGTFIDMTHKQQDLLLAIIKKHLPHTQVWAFGSRVTHTSSPEADMDLVVFIKPDQNTSFFDLKEALEESDLPFRVDLLDWNKIPENFKQNIRNNYVVLQESSD